MFLLPVTTRIYEALIAPNELNNSHV